MRIFGFLIIGMAGFGQLEAHTILGKLDLADGSRQVLTRVIDYGQMNGLRCRADFSIYSAAGKLRFKAAIELEPEDEVSALKSGNSIEFWVWSGQKGRKEKTWPCRSGNNLFLYLIDMETGKTSLIRASGSFFCQPAN